MFKRILCGVDESPESVEAVRQARQLADINTELLLVGVVDEAVAVHAGWAATAVLDDMRAAEVAALAAARSVGGRQAETRLVRGVPWSSIADLAGEEEADLVAVGSHEHRRTAGIVGGSVATYMLHEAPCSVLIARRCGHPDQSPRSIVAGFDGSACGVEALALARRLAEADERQPSSCRGRRRRKAPARPDPRTCSGRCARSSPSRRGARGRERDR